VSSKLNHWLDPVPDLVILNNGNAVDKAFGTAAVAEELLAVFERLADQQCARHVDAPVEKGRGAGSSPGPSGSVQSWGSCKGRSTLGLFTT
jgi:hypothetical protein